MPDAKSHALLVKTTAGYERHMPDGSREIFDLSDKAGSYPRRFLMTKIVDPAGNTVSIGHDEIFRVTTITDATGLVTNVDYEFPGDQYKITKVTDPFTPARYATFEYTAGKLTKITDVIGIQSSFTYTPGTDSVNTLTTPYGTTSFVSGENGTNRWIEITDPLGGKERVEYRDNAPGISGSDPVVPIAEDIVNAGLDRANTFYWDKKAMQMAPGDYTKAKIIHWLYNADGTAADIMSSEKQPLENRVWYRYEGQTDYLHPGATANPLQTARILGDGSTQIFKFDYNSRGKTTRTIDPVGRVMRYIYDPNDIDLLEVRQTRGANHELLRKLTYNTLHEPLTDTDAAGQMTTFTYNPHGQVLTRENAKHEITTYAYGGTAPTGHLESITSPAFNGNSAITLFGYDLLHRVRTVTNFPDNYTVTTDYDNLDRKIKVTYPDTTFEEFKYTDNLTGAMTLDLTGSRDRRGLWTYRRYNANQKMVSITDPLNQTTVYDWCTCGALESITDPKNQPTIFHRDIQSRVYQKVFADGSTIDYLFEGQTSPNTVGATSRLKSSTDALSQRTNYTYFADNNISSVSYTNISGNPLNPPTPTVDYTYDPNYNRVETMTDGIGLTTYAYYPITVSPALGAGKLQSIDGPLTDDTIGFNYDKLGRTIGRSLDGVRNDTTVEYDSLGRVQTTDNVLGHFERTYAGVTSRLQTLTYPNGQTAHYSYFGNEHDRRLQTLQNLARGTVNLSQFDYTYDADGQIMSWNKLLAAASFSLSFEYDDADQLRVANTLDPNNAFLRIDYGYDEGANRTSDYTHDPYGMTGNGRLNSYPAQQNSLNQLDSFSTAIDNQESQEVPMVYDLAGNLIDDGRGKTFEWDAANRLVAINDSRGHRSDFSYDGLSRRAKIVEKESGRTLTTQRFVWSGDEIVEERAKSDDITRLYFAEGEYRQSEFEAGEPFYYSRDHLGSIREMTDASGAVQARYDYDPYGKRTKLTGARDVDFGYTGHYFHQPSGLNLAMYRAYHPTLGRWLSRDPLTEAEIKQGPNLYSYVANDPVNKLDPLGEQAQFAIPAALTIEEILSGGAITHFLIQLVKTACDEHEKQKCRDKCNEDWHANEKVCNQQPEPYRTKCLRDIPNDLEKCIRRCNGGWY